MGLDKEGVVLELLPARWRQAVGQRILKAEEIRLRKGRMPTLLVSGEELPFSAEPVEESDLIRILEKGTGASFHTAEASLSDGYLTYRGVRIGVCGMASLKNGETSVFQHVSSLAIRIPRECWGICEAPIDRLLQEGYQNTLVIGSPGAGKTTVLREMIRRLADNGYRVGVADERNELAIWDGTGQACDLGSSSDILCGLPKAKAAMMLLRGMNPGIIAMDEITRERDLEALQQICGCGVGILASLHASSREDLQRREAYHMLLKKHLFTWLLLVHRTKAGRQYRLERCEP